MDDLGRIIIDAPTRLDLSALALASSFRAVDDQAALAELDRLAAVVAEREPGDDPRRQAAILAEVLGEQSGFIGNSADYDHPDNSMLDCVLERRTGLPILLSVVWIEVARRVGIPALGVGLPGHYIAAIFGADETVPVDPFRGGIPIEGLDGESLEPTPVAATVLRMLSNLVPAYERRGDLARMLTAARLRRELPLEPRDRRVMEFELRRLAAKLN